MDLTSEFTVEIPIERLWSILTDVERIAPCIPGFELKKVEDGAFEGTMRVKVGAVTMKYDSKGSFVERDDSAHRAVMTAEGREIQGQGGVAATITSTLTEVGGRTKATVFTNLSVTGRAAQFGRGILAEVSNRLVGQFVKCLETTVLGEEASPPNDTTPTGTPTSDAANENATTGLPSEAGRSAARKVSTEPPEPIDLLDVAGRPILKRVAIVAAAAALLALMVTLVRRSRQ